MKKIGNPYRLGEAEMNYPWEKNIDQPSRYMRATEVHGLKANLTVVPLGHCNWCGKPVPRKNQRFCPGIWEGEGVWKRRVYECYNVFFAYWVRIPRFKRVVFLRDNFTCKACGARPTFVNKHSIEMPDVNQLACDHIIPYSKGGETVLSNLQTLCRKCNEKKGNKTDWVPEGQVDLGEWLQLDVAQKVAADLGLSMTWEKVAGALIIGMGRSNEQIHNQYSGRIEALCGNAVP